MNGRKKQIKRKKSGRICLGMAAVISGILLIGHLKDDSSISAKPADAQPIVVDKDTTPYQIPFDAAKLLEPTLMMQTPKFDDFVQEDTQAVRLYKDKTRILSTGFGIHLTKGVINLGSNYCASITVFGDPGINTTLVTLYNSDASVLDYYWLGDDGLSKDKPVEGRRADQILAVNDDTFRILATHDIYDFKVENEKLVPVGSGRRTLERPKDYEFFWIRDWDKYNRPFQNGDEILLGEQSTEPRTNHRIYSYDSQTLEYKGFFDLIFPVSLEEIGFSDNSMIIERVQRYAGGMYTAEVSPRDGSKGYIVYWNDNHPIPQFYGKTDKQSDMPESKFFMSVKTKLLGQAKLPNKTSIVQVDSNEGIHELLALPKNTDVEISESEGEYIFAGTLSEFTGIFAPYKSAETTSGRFSFIMRTDKAFNVKTFTCIPTPTVDTTLEGLIKIPEYSKKFDRYIFFGRLSKQDPTFGDEFYSYAGISGKWNGNKYRPSSYTTVFNENYDYAPAINKSKASIMLNMDQLKEASELPYNKRLDNLLIYGNIKGSKSADSIKVTDFYDIDSGTTTYTQEWLENRINKNPLTYDPATQSYAPIDWKALGFTEPDHYGSNRVTYFITDSMNQTTATSRLVNKVNSQTIQNKKGILGAQNFVLPLVEAQALTEEKLKAGDGAYAQLKAWDANTGESILNRSPADGVTINADDLNKITKATKAGVFSLRLQLTYGSGLGETLQTRTISVFVGGTEQDGIWHNIQKSQIPWDISRSIKAENYLTSDYIKDNLSEIYEVSTGTKIDAANPRYEVKAEVTTLNATDPNPADAKATKEVAVPLSIWTKGEKPERKMVLTAVPDTKIYYRTQKVEVKLQDEDHVTLGKSLMIERIVGKLIVLSQEAEVQVLIGEAVHDKRYKLLNFYLDDDKTIYPETGIELPYKGEEAYVFYGRLKGELHFSVPATIAFKKSKVKAQDQDISAEATNQPIIIREHRKNSVRVHGWFISVSLTKDFTSGKDALTNVLYYGNQLITRTNTRIETNHGHTYYNMIPLNDRGKFHLKVPSGMAKKTTYTAEITWNLIAGP